MGAKQHQGSMSFTLHVHLSLLDFPGWDVGHETFVSSLSGPDGPSPWAWMVTRLVMIQR